MNLSDICKKIFEHKTNIPDVNWILYENGTVLYYSKEKINNKEELINISNNLIDEKVIPGTSIADFTINKMDIYFPNKYIYVVIYSQPELIGLEGREKRKK